MDAATGSMPGTWGAEVLDLKVPPMRMHASSSTLPSRRTALVNGVAAALAFVLLLSTSGAASAATDDGSITGVVFTDADRDGVRQADEPAMGGHLLYLYDATGSYVTNTTAAADGRYAFTGLSDGTYTVGYAPRTWRDLREQWVPTTTGSLHPEHEVAVAGEPAAADFGWRALVTSSDLSAPISEVTGPSGLRVQSYNDAVTAEEILDHISTEWTLGEEAAGTIVRFGYSSSNTNTSSVARSDGQVTSVTSTSYSTYTRWLDSGDRTMAHEYGHAWSNHHMYLGFDDGWEALLRARGIDPADERIGSSHAWMPGEIAAEDFRQLFASESARSGGQMNNDIPRPSEIEGYAAWLADVFGVAGASEPTEEPAPGDPGSTDPGPTDPDSGDPDPGAEQPPAAEPASIELSVTTSKVKGRNVATLAWTDAGGDQVDVRVDGAATTVANSGTWEHATGQRGNPSIRYQVCGAELCSEPVTVDSW